jgi:hypothetical protein
MYNLTDEKLSHFLQVANDKVILKQCIYLNAKKSEHSF